VLVGERGAYRMAKAPDAWQIPATAQAMLAARIDRLPPEHKRLLQAASVIGKDVLRFVCLRPRVAFAKEGREEASHWGPGADPAGGGPLARVSAL